MGEPQYPHSFVTKTSPWHVYWRLWSSVQRLGEDLDVERRDNSIALTQRLVPAGSLKRLNSRSVKRRVVANVHLSATDAGVLFSPECLDAEYADVLAELMADCAAHYTNKARELLIRTDETATLLTYDKQRWRWSRPIKGADIWGEYRWVFAVKASPIELLHYLYLRTQGYDMALARTRNGLGMC